VTTPQPVEAPTINGNHVIEESEVEKPSEVEIETLALEEKPTNEISIETNGPTNEIPIETNGISEDPKDVEKVEKEVDLTTINEDSTQTIGESPKNILPPPEASVPYPSSSKTNNQESVQAPILPASVKTVTPTFNRIPEVKPSTNFETAKKPVVVESNIGNTRIKDNGSNLAPTTNPATPRMRPTEITSTASTRKISSDNVVSQRKTLPEIKAGVSITYCEVFGSSRRRSIAQVMNYQSGHSGRNY